MLQADYIAAEGELEFGPGEVSKHIEIEIVDDQQYERDENFFVDLTDVEFIPEPTLEDVESPQKDDNNSPQAAEVRFVYLDELRRTIGASDSDIRGVFRNGRYRLL